MHPVLILLISLGYLAVLFGVAYYSERRAQLGKSLTRKPWIYALSLTVYCSAWTYFGAPGMAVQSGESYLPALIGPSIMAIFWLIWLRKAILVSKSQGVNSLADFLTARYGKSLFLGGMVTIVAFSAMLPYIALQLKAISTGIQMLAPAGSFLSRGPENGFFFKDRAFYIALAMAGFAMLFGTRKLDASEQQVGMVGAVAFEAIVRLAAYVILGIWVIWGLFNGPADLFAKTTVDQMGKAGEIWQTEGLGPFDWVVRLLLAFWSVSLLPHFFHLAVVENTHVNHLKKAVYLFPAYLFVFGLLAFPIGLAANHFLFGQNVNPDNLVMALPIFEGNAVMSVVVFVGGLAASAGGIIVTAVALSIMGTNSLLVPAFLQTSLLQSRHSNELTRRLVLLRRGTILAVILLAYAYYDFIGRHLSFSYAGYASLSLILQLAPLMFVGLFWRDANRQGAVAGLLGGFLVWCYTLLFPTMISLGWFPESILTDGPWGIGWLRPEGLFGLNNMMTVVHASVWALLVNLVLFITFSLFSRPGRMDLEQAANFVNTPSYVSDEREARLWRGKADLQELKMLMSRFLGEERTDTILEDYAQRSGFTLTTISEADSDLVVYAEKFLAGVIGTASARLLISSIVVEEPVTIEEVINVLDERQALLQYSQQLERKSRELQEKSDELKSAYQSLLEMDSLKNEFITTVTHELRTPVTSIRSLCSILYHNPDIPEEKRKNFLSIVISESERVSRLITQVLDLEKMEAGLAEMDNADVDMIEVVESSVDGVKTLIEEKNITLKMDLPRKVTSFRGDHDRLMQVVINLLSNAIKFCNETKGVIKISLKEQNQQLVLKVQDNGRGIPKEFQPYIFDKFTQHSDHRTGLRQGSGLGLSITWRIVRIHKGSIQVESEPGQGAAFIVSLPLVPGSVEPMLVPSYNRKRGALPEK